MGLFKRRKKLWWLLRTLTFDPKQRGADPVENSRCCYKKLEDVFHHADVVNGMYLTKVGKHKCPFHWEKQTQPNGLTKFKAHTIYNPNLEVFWYIYQVDLNSKD